MVRNLAEEMVQGSLGKNWTGQFVRRHQNILKSTYLRNMDQTRVKADYLPALKQFYDLFRSGIEKYHITADNTYNWDEKGFLIGQASATQRIMAREAFQQGRITHAAQDGNREFITLLACVCADTTYLPPSLIYKGESGLMQDT